MLWTAPQPKIEADTVPRRKRYRYALAPGSQRNPGDLVVPAKGKAGPQPSPPGPLGQTSYSDFQPPDFTFRSPEPNQKSQTRRRIPICLSGLHFSKSRAQSSDFFAEKKSGSNPSGLRWDF